MFGYELNHLILFNLEVLIASFEQFNESYIWLNFLGLVVSIASVLAFKMKLAGKAYYALLVVGSVVSSQIFHGRVFSDIFWPSEYFWLVSLSQALLSVVIVKKGLADLTENRRLVFGLLICVSTSVSFYLFKGLFLSVFTSLSISSLGYLVLAAGKRHPLFLLLFSISAIYFFSAGAAVASLFSE